MPHERYRQPHRAAGTDAPAGRSQSAAYPTGVGADETAILVPLSAVTLIGPDRSGSRGNGCTADGAGMGVGVLPRAGDVLRVTKTASVQFINPLLFRVIRVLDWPTYDGWAWLEGYQLNTSGDAIERRSIFVQVDGLQQVRTAQPSHSAVAYRGLQARAAVR